MRHKNRTVEIKPVKRSIKMFFKRCKRTKKYFLPLSDIDQAIAQAVIKNDQYESYIPQS